MGTKQRIIVAAGGLFLIGIAGTEHVGKRLFQHRYEEAVEARQRLERQFTSALTNHERITRELQEERTRSQALSEALNATKTELQQAHGRVSEEQKRVRELQLRVASLQQQTEQLQGELAMSLQERSGAAGASSPVQLEKIVVSDPGAAELRGRVLSVHQSWNFVVVDLGWDRVRIGDTISIVRNEQVVAKAKVERVQEQVCAATVLPEWNTAEVHVNDAAQVL